MSAGVSYTYRLRAANGSGESPCSNEAASQSVQMYFVHPDHLDTPRVITNVVGQVVWQWDSADPFGNNPPNENPSGLGNFTCNLRFPGQYFDKETNLHYNMARDYDPAIGRYIQSDPIGLGGGINTYGYVGGNPLSNVDPEGLQTAPGLPIPLPPVFIPGTPANQGFVSSVNQLIKKIKELCETDDSADCEFASSYQLKAAGIRNEHDFKAEFVGKKGVSRYDICACKDGSIKIAQRGQCGSKGSKMDTYAKWR